MHHTPMNIADFAISKCWDKECDMENVNTEKINRIANKFKHGSTIEHVTYNFEIKGVSRALLQELARHRHANLSVKSTRYTLKELKEDPMVGDDLNSTVAWAEKYVVFTDNAYVNGCIIDALNNLQKMVAKGFSNDITKYCLPEAYKTELVWTINARSLQNFLSLRTNKSALWEIRHLAYEVFGQLPQEHQFLFENHIFEEET